MGLGNMFLNHVGVVRRPVDRATNACAVEKVFGPCHLALSHPMGPLTEE